MRQEKTKKDRERDISHLIADGNASKQVALLLEEEEKRKEVQDQVKKKGLDTLFILDFTFKSFLLAAFNEFTEFISI